jgi:hypothetical protein
MTPAKQRITLLTLVNGLYEDAIYQGKAHIISPRFPALQLTAAQVFEAGQIDD